jgi:hypothetical protein
MNTTNQTEIPAHLGTEPKPMPQMPTAQCDGPFLSADEIAGRVELIFTPQPCQSTGAYPTNYNPETK